MQRPPRAGTGGRGHGGPSRPGKAALPGPAAAPEPPPQRPAGPPQLPAQRPGLLSPRQPSRGLRAAPRRPSGAAGPQAEPEPEPAVSPPPTSSCRRRSRSRRLRRRSSSRTMSSPSLSTWHSSGLRSAGGFLQMRDTCPVHTGGHGGPRRRGGPGRAGPYRTCLRRSRCSSCCRISARAAAFRSERLRLPPAAIAPEAPRFRCPPPPRRRFR